MRILMMTGGSSRLDSVHSHEQIPQRGYGDGHGNYGPRGKSYGHAAYYAGKGGKGYATHYAPPSSPYGYAPDGGWSYGYGPLHTSQKTWVMDRGNGILLPLMVAKEKARKASQPMVAAILQIAKAKEQARPLH